MKHQSNTPCFLKALEVKSKACNQPPINGSSLFEANL
ncbi:anthranilate synthase component I [Helicobacter pylori]|nr:anthranilate synthase component I [Helicobacter pylori]